MQQSRAKRVRPANESARIDSSRSVVSALVCLSGDSITARWRCGRPVCDRRNPRGVHRYLDRYLLGELFDNERSTGTRTATTDLWALSSL